MAELVRLLLMLVVVGGVMMAIERRWPALPKRPREGTRTDLTYWFFTPLVTRAITKVGLVCALIILALIAGVELTPDSGIEPLIADAWVQTLPTWVQGILLVVTLDFFGYWIHRWFHRGRPWDIHAIHHSSTTLDWLSSIRLHPLNDLIGGVARVVLVLLLGFDPLLLAFAVPLFAFYGLLLHANVPWDFGPLRWVLVSPKFHRWHHTSERDGLDRNFSNLFVVWDLMFGTYYMPEGRQPEVFGTTDPIPKGLWGQLRYPFRRKSKALPANKPG